MKDGHRPVEGQLLECGQLREDVEVEDGPETVVGHEHHRLAREGLRCRYRQPVVAADEGDAEVADGGAHRIQQRTVGVGPAGAALCLGGVGDHRGHRVGVDRPGWIGGHAGTKAPWKVMGI